MKENFRLQQRSGGRGEQVHGLMGDPLAGEIGAHSMPTEEVGRASVLLVFAVVALVCFFGLGAQPIYETDEGFAGTRADSLLRHGGWALSYDDVNEDQPQFRKPPLLYWIVAMLLKALGHTLWAVRLPTAAAGFLSALLLYRLARGALGEGAALLAALLTCAVPFNLLHIRTAMLELPVIFALLAGLAAVLLLPETWWRPVAVGLCGGAALMIKGGGGVPAIAIPVVFGLVHGRLGKRVWAEALVALGVAAILPALWYFAVPPEHRARLVGELVIGESAKRVKATTGAWMRLSVGGGVLATMLRWHLPSAVCGMVLAFARSFRNRALAEWLGVSLLVIVPLLWAYAAMVPPYPRYLLMALPFLLSFSAYFALGAASGRAAGILLVPYAAAALAFGDPWRWLPVGGAAAAMAAAWAGGTLGGPRLRRAAGVLLLTAISVASWESDSAWSMHPPPRLQPKPELVPLVREAARLTPSSEKLVLEDGLKAHTVLFYGRRAVTSYSVWLLSGLTQGGVSYGIFRGGPLKEMPGIDQVEIGRSGPWRLVRLEVVAGDRPLRGILLAKSRGREESANALKLLNVDFESFPQGFMLRAVPGDSVSEIPDAQQVRRVFLASGGGKAGSGDHALGTVSENESIQLEFPALRRITGVDILPESRQDSLAGWIVEAAVGAGPWAEVKRVEGAFNPYLTVTAGRVLKAPRAARVRFPPVMASRLRLVRTAADPIAVKQVLVFELRAGA